MANQWTFEQTVDLAKGARPVVYREALLFPGDARAHALVVNVTDRGQAVDLSGALAFGYFERAGGTLVRTVATADASGVVRVPFESMCYAFPGPLRLVVRLTLGGNILTVAECAFHVGRGIGNQLVDDQGVLPTLPEMLSEIARLEAANARADQIDQRIADFEARTDAKVENAQDRIDTLVVSDMAFAERAAALEARAAALESVAADARVNLPLDPMLDSADVDLLPLFDLVPGGFAADGQPRESPTQVRFHAAACLSPGDVITASVAQRSGHLYHFEYDARGAFIRYTDHTVTAAPRAIRVASPVNRFAFYLNGAFATPEDIRANLTLVAARPRRARLEAAADGAINLLMGAARARRFDLLEVVDLEPGRFDTATGAPYASTTQCRVARPLRLPLGSRVLVTPDAPNRGFYVYKYDADGAFIAFEAFDNVDLGGLVYRTDAPVLNFCFYTGSDDTARVRARYAVSVDVGVQPWAGKKLSVLGDSLSTFDGVSPADRAAAFYPKGGVRGVGQTYWGMAANLLGMALEVNDSYSSSTVTSPNAEFSYMADDARLAALGNPDLILFCGGTNDLYADRPLGEWSDAPLDQLDTARFIPAYAKCLRALQANYPAARVVAISPAFIDPDYTPARAHCTPGNLHRFVEAQRDACRALGVDFIDARALGMNAHNLADYTVDALHWNYAFTRRVAEAIARVVSEKEA